MKCAAMHPVTAALLLLAAAAQAQDYGRSHRIKLDIGGQSRKAVLFLPKGLRKHEALPLLVAIPKTGSKAFLELNQWQQPAFDKRFAVFSVDTVSAGKEGWSPRDKLVMARDIDALLQGLDRAMKIAKREGAAIDRSATVITGHSGDTYLALWVGLRRPDLFLGICGRGCVFHRETVEWGKLDTVPPNYDQRIFLYRGELDHPRVIEQTELAHKTLLEAGYRSVTYKVVPKMIHESKPEVFLEWYTALLKETAKGRADARKVAAGLVKIKEMIAKKRAGAYGKLQKLVDREKRAGFPAGAVALMKTVVEEARKSLAKAEDLEADHAYGDALQELKRIERAYRGLQIAKQARARAASIRRSDGYKAAEMLGTAKGMLEKGKREQAFKLLEKITKQYPETVAAEEAAHLLKS